MNEGIGWTSSLGFIEWSSLISLVVMGLVLAGVVFFLVGSFLYGVYLKRKKDGDSVTDFENKN